MQEGVQGSTPTLFPTHDETETDDSYPPHVLEGGDDSELFLCSPRHSDYTVPTSNVHRRSADLLEVDPSPPRWGYQSRQNQSRRVAPSKGGQPGKRGLSPPLALGRNHHHHHQYHLDTHDDNGDDNDDDDHDHTPQQTNGYVVTVVHDHPAQVGGNSSRRTIFGRQVQRKYAVEGLDSLQGRQMAAIWNQVPRPHDEEVDDPLHGGAVDNGFPLTDDYRSPSHQDDAPLLLTHAPWSINTAAPHSSSALYQISLPPEDLAAAHRMSDLSMPDAVLAPYDGQKAASTPRLAIPWQTQGGELTIFRRPTDFLSPLTPSSPPSLGPGFGSRLDRHSRSQPPPTPGGTTAAGAAALRRPRPHETVHAQSLLLGLAFAAVWTPSNLMAPNLTEMAASFGFTRESERDLYLGSYCALATGVLSFPLAAGIGILADLMSRQRLFVITVCGGALTCAATGLCRSYWQLFLARLLSGGFMSGSVPVAFSFLGDLFSTEERNAASSGLTAMMGLGIIMGQVYAGMVGSAQGWRHAFFVFAGVALVLAMLCLCLVEEPVRGGKEPALQDMIKAGTRYDRQLTWSGFLRAMQNNQSNRILLGQGFFSSLPWGIIFVFLNDYLSQERGFSVPDATYLVLLFGLGCALGGVLGGWLGQLVQTWNLSLLPLFMAVTTAAGFLPFFGLLNTKFTNARGFAGVSLALLCGLVASLPSVNVRPCLINVNPPETRGASLTAANLLISLGRGMGPSCITLMVSIWHVDRQFAFNVTLATFWLISAGQLLLLAGTLTKDQDAMEAELASYAQAAMARRTQDTTVLPLLDDGSSLVSIEERMTSFDSVAAKETFLYVREGIKELREEFSFKKFMPCDCVHENSDDDDESRMDGIRSSKSERQGLWRQQQQGFVVPDPSDLGLAGETRGQHTSLYHPINHANETTPLIV